MAAMDEVHVTLILSKFDEISRQLSEDRRDSAESRRRTYEKLDSTNASITALDSRVDGLEKSINTMSPTVAEFLEYKAQVRGAGRLGKGLWWLGGFILGAAVALVNGWNWILSFLTNR